MWVKFSLDQQPSRPSSMATDSCEAPPRLRRHAAALESSNASSMGVGTEDLAGNHLTRLSVSPDR